MSHQAPFSNQLDPLRQFLEIAARSDRQRPGVHDESLDVLAGLVGRPLPDLGDPAHIRTDTPRSVEPRMPHWFVCTILASGFGLATVVLGFDLQGAITLIAGLLLALITLFGLRPTSSIRVMTMSTSFGVQPSALISRSEYLVFVLAASLDHRCPPGIQHYH